MRENCGRDCRCNERILTPYDTFMANSVVEVNWLDPNDRVSDEERENVLIKLWNFSVNQEEEEERRYSRGDYDDDDIFQ